MDPETTISPKVIAVAIVNVALVAIVAALNAVTPELLEGIGPWSVVLYGAITAVASTLAGYIKRDPLRS